MFTCAASREPTRSRAKKVNTDVDIGKHGTALKKLDEVKRLLKVGDLDAVRIAEHVGVKITYVHMVRNAMERAGEL